MEDIKLCRKLAIMMDKTGFELVDICAFLNATYDFWYGDDKADRRDYGKYMRNYTKFTKAKIHQLNVAMNQMFNEEPYPLAKEYAMMNNVLAKMEEIGFEQYNQETYQDALNYLEETGNQIVLECENKYANAFKDVMCNGKITEDNKKEAILRYMANEAFFLTNEHDPSLN